MLKTVAVMVVGLAPCWGPRALAGDPCSDDGYPFGITTERTLFDFSFWLVLRCNR